MKEGVTTHLSASNGFAEVVEDKVVMLLDTAEPAEEIDIERAKRALERAETALKTVSFDHAEYLMHEMALYRAIARISVASKKMG
jgi:F-type H+-transporting ATPase subunit epsilon